jgi:hypothetical protein
MKTPVPPSPVRPKRFCSSVSRRRPSPFGLIAGSSKAAFDFWRCS